jgi:hypothetical protein
MGLFIHRKRMERRSSNVNGCRIQNLGCWLTPVHSCDLIKVSNGPAFSVMESEEGRVVGSPGVYLVNDLRRRRNWGPGIPDDGFASVQGHEVVDTLKVSGWTKANRSFGASSHTFAWSSILMDLAVGTKR